MSGDASGRYPAGQTALLAAVDAVDSLVGPWRRRFDPPDLEGIPAHVTVLYPFLDVDRIDASAIEDLRGLFGGHAPFTIRFDGCRRFPDVLYLAPTPDQPFRALTEAVTARWPEAPPYGGQFEEVIPHLTVVDGQPSHVYDEVEAALVKGLPVFANISSVQLFVSDGERWGRRADFPLLG